MALWPNHAVDWAITKLFWILGELQCIVGPMGIPTIFPKATSSPLHSLALETDIPLATFTHALSGCRAEMSRFLTFPLCYQGVCSHMYGWLADRSAILFETEVVWGMWFRSGPRKLGVGLICCWVDFAPALSPLHHTCNVLCWSQFLACARELAFTCCWRCAWRLWNSPADWCGLGFLSACTLCYWVT